MKRSRNLKLTLMLGLPAVLAGCDSGPPTGTVVASVEDCSNVDGISLDECKGAYQQASREHQRVAPRFASAAQCNEQFGNCEARQEGHQPFFSPGMTGFLIGYSMSGALSRRADAGGSFGPRQVAGASPLYREFRTGNYLKPGGDVAARQPGPVTGARGNAATPARATTISRSGFGSRGSFGG